MVERSGTINSIIVSAGDAITARLIQEAGFDGIWVSGFEVSARMGLPDNGSVTMTEMLTVCKPIIEAVSIPVYVDVDTGYGNFARTVREFERIGTAGICVEDNLSPKQNSLWGGKCCLLPMEEFGRKIKVPHSLILIARTEALIRGYSKDEAIRRLDYYIKCGANMVLPHTRDEKYLLRHTFDVPSAIVPTKFPYYSNDRLFSLGYSMVIWANQTERVKIKAIRKALKTLKDDDRAIQIEKRLSATLEDMKGLT